MTSDFVKLTIKSRIWIENEKGEVVFGAGRLKILRAVEKHGSLHAASINLNMSYRAVWGKIKATEDHLGRKLLVKRTGGMQGGGSELTPFAKALMDRFEHFEALTRTTVDTLFEQHFLNTLPEKVRDTTEDSS